MNLPTERADSEQWRANSEQRIDAVLAEIAGERADSEQWRANSEQRIDAVLAEIAGERAQREQWDSTLESRIEALSANHSQVFANQDQRGEAAQAMQQSLEDRLAYYVGTTATLESTVSGLLLRVAELEALRSTRGNAVQDPDDLTSYWEQVEENYRPISAAFSGYRSLVAELVAIDRIVPVPLCKFGEPIEESLPSGVLLGMRHDIDADPRTAVRMARCLALHGLSGSFYFLHSSRYYGRFEDDSFVRNPEVEGWVSDVIVAGSEIGLHNDALGVWQNHDQDGGIAIKRELAYLRGLGAQVSGTVGHNSAPSYGAENCEVFEGAVLFNRPANTPVAERLGLLDPQQLGLTYEGTYAIPRETVDGVAASAFIQSTGASTADEDWMRTYLTDNPILSWSVDAQLWSQGQDKWVLGGRDDMWHWGISTSEALNLVAAMPDGSRVLAVIHPALYRT